MPVVTSWESWTLVPSVASLLEVLLLLGQVVPTLGFMGRASDKGSLTRGQVLGSFTSYSSHPLPKPTALSCLYRTLPSPQTPRGCSALSSCGALDLPLCRAP